MTAKILSIASSGRDSWKMSLVELANILAGLRQFIGSARRSSCSSTLPVQRGFPFCISAKPWPHWSLNVGGFLPEFFGSARHRASTSAADKENRAAKPSA
jgi:hypothetical protein